MFRHRHDLRRLRETSETSRGEACRRQNCHGGSGQEGGPGYSRRGSRIARPDRRGDPEGGEVPGKASGITKRRVSKTRRMEWTTPSESRSPFWGAAAFVLP